MMTRKLFLWVLLCSFFHLAFGQQQATFSQYMFNGLAINPAYAGSHDALSATALLRYQNIGLPGAPRTQTLSAHSPLLKQNIALGFLMIHDQVGVIDQFGFNAIYAYRLYLSKNKDHPKVLSFGLQGGLSHYQARYSELTIYNNNDPAFTGDISQLRPNFGFGIYYYSSRFYGGLSLPHLMNNVFDRNEDLETIYQTNPILLQGGYVFPINRFMKLKPNFLIKFLNQDPVEIDINANLSFDDVVWVGVSYKALSAVNFLAEIQATDQLRIGYAYSATTSTLRQVEQGSHEFMINYIFRYPKQGVVSPRHF